MKRHTGIKYKEKVAFDKEEVSKMFALVNSWKKWLVKAVSIVAILWGLSVGINVSSLTYQNSTNVSFTFEPTVTIALSGNKGANLVINDLAPGSAADSNIITITAGTNSGVGYNLTASAGSSDSNSAYYNSNALKNGSSTMSSLASSVSTLEAITAGQWGYSYSVDNGTNWVSGSTGSTSTGYAGLPAVNGAAVTLASTSTNAQSIVQFKIAAKADSNQVSGTYSNVVNFSATVKPITTTYTITYYDDSTAMSDPAPVTNTISSGNTANVILNSTATKSGYTLTGWCYGTITNNTCSGTLYQPGENYTVGNIGGIATINLYAVWKSAAPDYIMQEIADWESDLDEGDEVTAMDSRDGKTYTVARLADGNIWMTQNLDFDIVDGGADLDSTNTDVPSNWSDAGNLTDTYATEDTTWEYYIDQPESYNPGDLCWNGTIAPNYSGTLSTYAGACSSDKHYHIGNYYNWTAAVVMSDSSSYTARNTDVDQSICPAGWMLPKSGSTLTGSGSFQYLVNQASLTSGTSGNIQSSPVYFVYGGGWGGSSDVVGADGSYWSSVVSDDYSAYYLYFNADGGLDPQYVVTRDGGFSVRCVARLAV